MQRHTKLYILAAMLVGLWLVTNLFTYLMPFVIGAVVAALIHPAVDYCEQKGFPRGIASFVFVFIVFGGLLAVISFAVIGLWYELDQLMEALQNLYGYSTELINRFLQDLRVPLQDMIPAISNSLSEFATGLLKEALNFISKLPNTIFTWFLAGMTAFLVCRDKAIIARFITANLPAHWQRKFSGWKHQVLKGLFAYLKAQMMIMWVSACLSVSGFLLINQPYAWVLGITAGLFDILPIIGPSGVFLPVIIYNLYIGMLSRSILLSVVWLLVLIVRQLYEPQVVSSQVGLHPLTAMIAVYLGVNLLGISGFILGPLLMIVGKAFYMVMTDD